MKIIFSHGKESGPWGSKIKALAKIAQQLGHEVDSIDYRGIMSPDERVRKLECYLNNEISQPYVLVGSSMGGYVSLVCAQQYNQQQPPKGLFLLAPALFIVSDEQQEYDVQTYKPIVNTTIIHGWSDDIIPVEHSIKYAQQTKCTLHLIDGDHRLNTSLNQVVSLFTVFLEDVVQ